MRRAFDVVVIGGGTLGVNIASLLKARSPALSVLVLEKEPALGLHGTGRNSGVGHSGLYYPSSSLKAQLTQRGNAWLRAYAKARGIPINECGKLIPARHAGDLPGIATLLSRGRENGVPLEALTPAQALRLEPLLRVHETAIWSPSTFAADPLAVLAAQVSDALSAGVVIETGRVVTGLNVVRPGYVHVTAMPFSGAPYPSRGVDVPPPPPSPAPAPASPPPQQQGQGGQGQPRIYEAGHVINAAGLYADKLAHSVGFGGGLKMIPFKGVYLYSTLPLTRLVYPVPDLTKPFLGVHFTVTPDGRCKIGPTAMPAWWRENYGDEGTPLGHRWEGGESAEILATQASMFLGDASFRSLAIEESLKRLKSRMIAGAGELVRGGDDPAAYTSYGRAGIRAQLVDTRHPVPRLVMDYLIEGDASTTHVLNAVSPGWTTAHPFAQLVVDRVLGGGPDMEVASQP